MTTDASKKPLSFGSSSLFLFHLYYGDGYPQDIEDGYSFEYDSKYLEKESPSPVSLTLPITDTPYSSKTLFAFFDGLIPEGWLLDLVVKNWKLDARDRFGILLVACKDPIGNVSIMEKK